MSSYDWPDSDTGSDRVAVLLPGGGYTAQAPLLYWTATLLVEQGWHVRAVEWDITEDVRERPFEFVEAAVERAFDQAPAGGTRLVVAKSFGTHALPWAVANKVPGVWLTPILIDETICAALSQAGPDHLAVGGDHDVAWRPDDVGPTESRLVTVPRADHGLEVPSGWRASIETQADLLGHVAQHAARLRSG